MGTPTVWCLLLFLKVWWVHSVLYNLVLWACPKSKNKECVHLPLFFFLVSKRERYNTNVIHIMDQRTPSSDNCICSRLFCHAWFVFVGMLFFGMWVSVGGEFQKGSCKNTHKTCTRITTTDSWIFKDLNYIVFVCIKVVLVGGFGGGWYDDDDDWILLFSFVSKVCVCQKGFRCDIGCCRLLIGFGVYGRWLVGDGGVGCCCCGATLLFGGIEGRIGGGFVFRGAGEDLLHCCWLEEKTIGVSGGGERMMMMMKLWWMFVSEIPWYITHTMSCRYDTTFHTSISLSLCPLSIVCWCRYLIQYGDYCM